MTPQEALKTWQEAELLCSQAQVEAALDSMARQITDSLQAINPLCLCVMNGGIIPSGQLLPRLQFPLQLDYIHATRYRGGTRGHDLQWLKYPTQSLTGREVLIIDDILDEGMTLAQILDYCRQAGAARVHSAVLADKQRPRSAGGLERADFTGLVLPDRYVFGYGLDYHGYLRNAAGIYAVRGM